MSEHTPGPWTVDRVDEYARPRVVTVDGMLVALVHQDSYRDANARLIAAAPELLAALEELAHPTMDSHELAHLSDMQQEDIALARAAIAKATGSPGPASLPVTEKG